MTHDLRTAIAAASPAALADLRLALYAAHGAGQIGDAEAEALDAAIEARRAGRPAAQAAAGQALGDVVARASIFPSKRRQRSPDRAASITRRRTIAASGPLPPAIAARFTVGQQAVLGVVADELAAAGRCTLSVGEIAARAGVSHRLAQGALRLAEGDGLLTITERPQKGRKHETNLIRVLSSEWAGWLARRRPPGCRTLRPTGSKGFSCSEKAPSGSGATGFRGGSRGSRPEPGGGAPDSGERRLWQMSSQGRRA